MKKLLVLLLLTTNICFAQPSIEKIELHYIANEGFLIKYQEYKILIDALFDNTIGNFASPSAATTYKMLNAEPPFDSINLVLITHKHSDHFDAEMTIEYLKNNPYTKVVAPQQAVDEMRKFKSYEKVKENITESDLYFGEIEDIKINGIDLEILCLKHGPYFEDGKNKHENIINLSYLIKLDDKEIFHAGDGTYSFNAEIIQKLNVPEHGIDLLFIEYFDNKSKSVEIVKGFLKPKHLVAMHIPPSKILQLEEFIKIVYPDAIIFTDEMDKKYL